MSAMDLRKSLFQHRHRVSPRRPMLLVPPSPLTSCQGPPSSLATWRWSVPFELRSGLLGLCPTVLPWSATCRCRVSWRILSQAGRDRAQQMMATSSCALDEHLPGALQIGDRKDGIPQYVLLHQPFINNFRHELHYPKEFPGSSHRPGSTHLRQDHQC